jgi:hypothetical protein
MRFIYLLLFSIIFFNSYAQSPSLSWLNSQNFPAEGIVEIVEDLNGDIFISGRFSDSVDFDPGVAVFPLIATGQESAYIAKFDGNGEFVTAAIIKADASSGTSEGNQIAGISSIKLLGDGSIVVNGLFRGSLSISGSDNISVSASNYDGFIAKLDSDLNYIWSHKISAIQGSGVDYGISLAIDSGNNIYSLFQIGSSISAQGYSIDGSDYTSSNGMNSALIKFASDGGFIGDAKFFSGTMSQISMDIFDNVYITFLASASGTTINGSLLLGSQSSTISLVSLDSNLGLRWVQRYGGNSVSSIRGLRCGHDGVYLFGRTEVDIPSQIIVDRQLFLIKADTANGDVLWTKQIGVDGEISEEASSLTVFENEIVVSGTYQSTLSFDGQTLASNGATDNFLIAFDSIGIVQYKHSIGSTLSDTKLTMNNQGARLILSGLVGPNCNFNLTGGNASLGTDFHNAFAKYQGLEEPEAPSVFLGIDTIICVDEDYILSTGLSVLEYNHIWNTGSTNNFIIPAETGEYYVDVFTSSDNTLIGSDTIIISIEEIDFSIGNDTTLQADSYTIEAPFPGIYYWSTGEEGNSITVSESGNYSVSYYSLAGCVYNDDITVVLLPVSIHDALVPRLKVSPNPFENQFRIENAHEYLHGEYQIFDLSGKLIKQGNMQASAIIDLNEIHSGIYLMHLYAENTLPAVLKLLKN